jgi:uncharacterized repeat protein (TIGR03803 family)
VPAGRLWRDASGNLFGTTEAGGAFNGGSVFELPAGSGTIITLGSFNGATTGFDPWSGVVEDSSGNLFGTTIYGPAFGYGTVFEVKQGSGTITTLAAFNGTNGETPYNVSGLALDSSGNLFGTTLLTQAFNNGTVFEVQHGSGTITTLASFNFNNGSQPEAGLAMDSSCNLFGTTTGGGASRVGTVFELSFGFTLPSITTSTLANWTINQVGYNQTITANCGTAGITFSQTAGILPPGLTLNSSGVLSGTPTATGSFSFTVTATKSASATSSQSYTLTINPAVTITTTALSTGTSGTAYSQTVSATGGTGSLTFAVTAGTLPSGLTLSSSGVLAGTPNVGGSWSFTVTATDTVGAAAAQSFTATINPGPFSQYLVTILGSSTVQAGDSFQVTVQAADRYGNAVTSYSGPATVTATISPTSAASNFPITVPISSSGLGFFLANLQKTGSYTITVADKTNVYTGSAAPMMVTPGQAVNLRFATQPVSTPTGDVLPPVTAQVQDLYGNVVASDNSDTIMVGVASGPGAFTSGSTLTAMVHAGVANFNNLTLVNPGTYQLSALVPTLYTGPYSVAFSIVPLEVIPGSFAGTPSGFSLQLNAPILVNSVTPALYGRGASAGATVTPTVTLTQTTGTPPAGNTLPYPVPGSLIVNGATNTLTYVETDTSSLVNNGTPLLPDGVYVVHINSSGVNGLQALNSGGGYLDGTSTGTAGHDFTATFTVGAAASGADVLWVPATADGPGQPLSAPGMNKTGGGYPIYLNDTSGAVTNVQLTLSYDPTLLSVTGVTGASFSLSGSSTPGHAMLQYSGPALPAGRQTPIGFLTATVPSGTSASPVPYRAQDLLHLSGVSLNAGAISVATSDGLHLVAYVGDASGDGAYSSDDALRITRVLVQADTGFAAYPRTDPVIVADTGGSGFIPADAALQVNEAGVGVPAANLPVPPIPPGVVFHTAARYAYEAVMKTTNNTNHTNKRLLVAIALDDLDDLLAWQMLMPPSRRLLRR